MVRRLVPRLRSFSRFTTVDDVPAVASLCYHIAPHPTVHPTMIVTWAAPALLMPCCGGEQMCTSERSGKLLASSLSAPSRQSSYKRKFRTFAHHVGYGLAHSFPYSMRPRSTSFRLRRGYLVWFDCDCGKRSVIADCVMSSLGSPEW